MSTCAAQLIRASFSTQGGSAKAMTVKKDDEYEMAIQFRKEEDFSGWYSDVSCIPRRHLSQFIVV